MAEISRRDTSGARHAPRTVPAVHGWRWLTRGFGMVFARPAHWIGALVILAIFNIVLSLVPLVGILSALLSAVFMGGLMFGAQEQELGEGFKIDHLFAGFSIRFGPLVVLGLLYFVALVAIVLVVAVLAFGAVLIGAEALTVQGVHFQDVAVSPIVWLGVLVLFGAMLPLIMAYWFAPALVMLDDVPPLTAMGMSLQACGKNMLPFLVYGMIALLLFVLGAIPLLLGLLVVVPAMVASVYVAYRDIFVE